MVVITPRSIFSYSPVAPSTGLASSSAPVLTNKKTSLLRNKPSNSSKKPRGGRAFARTTAQAYEKILYTVFGNAWPSKNREREPFRKEKKKSGSKFKFCKPLSLTTLSSSCSPWLKNHSIGLWQGIVWLKRTKETRIERFFPPRFPWPRTHNALPCTQISLFSSFT